MDPAGNSQQAVIDFLGRPATHGGAPVKRIDTHAATVFLAGDRAFKIKRAVRFPFLDYSTLDRLAAANRIDGALAEALAGAVVRAPKRRSVLHEASYACDDPQPRRPPPWPAVQNR